MRSALRLSGLRGCESSIASSQLRVGTFGEAPVLRLLLIFERAVAHLFGIDAAVGGEVDVLEEDAPQVRRDGVTRLIDLDVDCARSEEVCRDE